MAPKSFLITLAALTFASTSLSGAQAQEVLSAEELARCELLLASLDPSVEPTLEQAECIALLAQLGVEPALGPDDADRAEGSDT